MDSWRSSHSSLEGENDRLPPFLDQKKYQKDPEKINRGRD